MRAMVLITLQRHCPLEGRCIDHDFRQAAAGFPLANVCRTRRGCGAYQSTPSFAPPFKPQLLKFCNTPAVTLLVLLKSSLIELKSGLLGPFARSTRMCTCHGVDGLAALLHYSCISSSSCI